MPNWCSNLVQITGPENDIKDIKNKLQAEDDNVFCFHSVLPYDPDNTNEETTADYRQFYNHPQLDWQTNNWGTKWDSVDAVLVVDEPTRLVYKFLTAWSPCDKVIQKLSELYPNLFFEHNFAEPGIGFSGNETYNAPNDYNPWDVMLPQVHDMVQRYIDSYDGN